MPRYDHRHRYLPIPGDGSALQLWTGAPFPDLTDWPLARPAIDRLDDLRLGLVWVAGSPTAAAALLEPDTATRQYDESLCLLLARAHDAAGRPTDAFGTIRSLQRPLRDDLGVDAAEEVRELEARMHDRAVALPRRAVRSAAGPWPGLLPHERDDARRFFGREKELEVAAGDRPWARSN